MRSSPGSGKHWKANRLGLTVRREQLKQERTIKEAKTVSPGQKEQCEAGLAQVSGRMRSVPVKKPFQAAGTAG